MTLLVESAVTRLRFTIPKNGIEEMKAKLSDVLELHVELMWSKDNWQLMRSKDRQDSRCDADLADSSCRVHIMNFYLLILCTFRFYAVFARKVGYLEVWKALLHSVLSSVQLVLVDDADLHALQFIVDALFVSYSEVAQPALYENHHKIGFTDETSALAQFHGELYRLEGPRVFMTAHEASEWIDEDAHRIVKRLYFPWNCKVPKIVANSVQ